MISCFMNHNHPLVHSHGNLTSHSEVLAELFERKAAEALVSMHKDNRVGAGSVEHRIEESMDTPRRKRIT